MSPELLDPEGFDLKDGRPTEISDCYALGMVIYEVLSGRLPFFSCRGYVIFAKILNDERPARPRGPEGRSFTNGVWDVLERCWSRSRGDRPEIEDVLRCLEKVSRSWVPPQEVAEPLKTDPSTRNVDSSSYQASQHAENQVCRTFNPASAFTILMSPCRQWSVSVTGRQLLRPRPGRSSPPRKR